MDRLARPLGELQGEYPIVVVGSGYGGAIAACRLSSAGYDVCVLERGKELQPGEYPNTTWKALKELQARRAAGSVGARTALFDVRVHRDISVLVGCGLGGTSLINAGVAVRALDDVFDDARWPSELRGKPEVLNPFYERAEAMLGSNRYPGDWPELAKLRSLEVSANEVGGQFTRPLINVTFADGLNNAGIEQQACVLCGDCITGCNHHAKNTVLMNYLPVAARNGAQIFTQTEVRTVVPREDGTWLVSFTPIGVGRERFAAPTQFVVAHGVVLAAGTLGSTEILLRSRAAGLPVSAQLGSGFSGNGDCLGFGYDARHHIHAMGRGRRASSPRRPVGPTIAGMIERRDRQHGDSGVLLEEGAAPGPLARVLPSGLALAAVGLGQDGDRRVRTVLRWLLGALLGPYRGPTDRTQIFLIMSNDDGRGRIVPADDGVDVEWPDVADRPVFQRDSDVMQRAATAIGATYIRDPIWESPIGNTLITVQPLGGAVMADHAKQGVVNHRGQVFTGTDEEGVHETLFVADGSIIPRALAVNPHLTISALAERTCDEILKDPEVRRRLGTPKERSERPPEPAPTLTRPGLRFTEAMRGGFSARGAMTEHDRYRGPASQGRADGTGLELVVTVEFDDLDHLIRAPASPGRLSGTVVAPELSPRRLTIVDGTFHLFEPDPRHVQTVRMGYDMNLVSEAGRTYHLHGEKVLHHGSVRAGWCDTTTTNMTVTDEAGHVVGGGMLRLSLQDFVRELATIRVLRVTDPFERAAYLQAFLRLFLGTLMPLYGGVLAEDNRFQPAPSPGRIHPTPPRLRSGPGPGGNPPPPQVHWRGDTGWHAGDEPGPDASLRLTRYAGGSKGPVLIAPGLAMSAWSFAGRTTEQNLVEYLVEHDYDVWLFDYRACIDLPSARKDFTIDQVATDDWPAAVAHVIDQTKTTTGVQAVGHCVGSVSLLMSLLSGAVARQDIRSAVCSQFTTHIETSLLGRLKAALRVSQILDYLGIRELTPDSRRTWAHALIDVTLGALPVPRQEHCGRAVCRWLNAIYGMTHCHAQLNDATHDALAVDFGVGNLRALNQLSLMFRVGRAVDHQGKDIYLRHPERLQLPILFLVGELNYIFHPKGTEKTLKWLKRHNPEHLYTTARFKNYAHLDSFVGRDAHRDVFPKILEHLNRYSTPPVVEAAG